MNGSPEIVHRITSQAKGVKSSKNGFIFCCPFHDDRNPSAQLTIGNKRIFLKCRAGCTEEQMCAAFGIDTSELYFTPYKKFDPNWNLDDRIQTNYFYTDEEGKVLYEHPRMKQRTDKDPKCLYRRPLGDGSYVWTLDAGWCVKKGRDYFLVRDKTVVHSRDKRPNLPNVRWFDAVERRVPYRLPELLQAKPGEKVFVLEGEKDADNLREFGLIATTAGGAGDWRPGFAEYFSGVDLVTIPDNDTAGLSYAAQVARDSYGKASRVRTTRLPGLKVKEDFSDWKERGGTREQLFELIDLSFPYFPADIASQEDEKFAPVSEDKELEEFLWGLGNGTSRLLSAIQLLIKETQIEGDHMRLISALLIVGRDKKTGEYIRGTVEITHSGLASVYPNNGGKSSDTVGRDIKKFLAAQANKGIELLGYIKGSQDFKTGKNYKSKFQRHFLRYGLQIIGLAMELSGVQIFDKQALQKLTLRRIKEACKIVTAGIPRKVTIPTKLNQQHPVSLEAEKARAIRQMADYLRHLLSDGKEVETVAEEAEEVYLEALSKALKERTEEPKSAEPIVRMHADYRSAENQPLEEVITIQ